MGVICEWFDLDFEYLKEIKQYDIAAQDLEYQTFFKGKKFISGHSPSLSLQRFMEDFNRLNN